MATPGSDSFNHALHTANIRLADIGSAFGTRDRRYSQRMLRTWLHALRDRLTIDAAAKFAQQLPELLRGSYYDGWEPNRVPIKYPRSGRRPAHRVWHRPDQGDPSGPPRR